METANASPGPVEYRADLEQAARASGVPMPSDYKLERWRREGLLPPVEQIVTPYDGSSVEFPAGTAKQIVEIQRLLKIKNRFDYVGWELWWAGFLVDVKYWKPQIENTVKPFEQKLALIDSQLIAEEESDNFIEQHDTYFDRVSNFIGLNKLASRISKRITFAQRAIMMRLLIEVGRGRFNDFAPPSSQTENSEQDVLMQAFDIRDGVSHKKSKKEILDPENAENHFHQVMGHRLDLTNQLPPILQGMSSADFGNLSEVLEYSQAELEVARNDVRNALQIALCLYDTLSFSHGQRAFGLRLIAWQAKRATVEHKAFWIAGIAAMRRGRNVLLPSGEIENMAKHAVYAQRMFQKFMDVVEANPQLKKEVTPKALRLALSDKYELKRFEERLARIAKLNISAPLKHPHKGI